MVHSFVKDLLLGGLLALTLLPVQFSPSFAQHYHIQNFKEKDGMGSNSVFSVAQDSLGVLYFSTRNGLTSFDGIRWEKTQSRDSETPHCSGLVSIDEEGTLWWVPKRLPGRFFKRTNGQWESLPQSPDRGLNWEFLDQESWVDSRGQAHLVASDYFGRLHHWDGRTWQIIMKEINKLVIFSMEKVESKIWLSTSEGLITIDLETLSKIKNPVPELPEGGVYASAHNPVSGVTWVLGHQWLARFENGNFRELLQVPELEMTHAEPPTSAAQGPDGSLYFVDFGRIYNYQPHHGLETLTSVNGLSNKGANFVMRDREQNVWVTSQRGVSQIISRRLACYDHNLGLLGDDVSAILELDSGQMVLGHQKGLTFFGPPMKKLPFNIDNKLLSRVIDLAEDENGQIWIAADRQGLGLMQEDHSIEWFDSEDGLTKAVYSVLCHSDLGTLVGTSDGLYRKAGQRFEKVDIPFPAFSTHHTIRRLFKLTDNSVGIATGTHGIYIWKDNQFHHIVGDITNGSTSTYAVFEPKPGVFWVGTTGGLFEIVGDKLERTTAPDPVIQRPIYSITSDDQGRFWFGTDEGVTIWDGSKKSRLTTNEGLIGNETNRDALLMTKDGQMWIGTDGGLSIYRSELDIPPTTPPILSLTKMKVNGAPHPVDQPLNITGPLKSLTYFFRAPTFSPDNTVQFTAKDLLNPENDTPLIIHWPGVLPLTNLAPGQHQFQILATTSQGLESNLLITPIISINPPFQSRWYIRIPILLFRLALAWVIFAYLMGKRYSRKLEKEVLAQTADLRLSEETARLESERLQGTLSSISDGVIVVDGQGKTVVINQAAAVMFGPTTELKIGCLLVEILNVNALVDKNQARRYQQLLKDPAGIHFASEQVAIHVGKGAINWYEITAVSISGSSGGLVFAFRDITESRHQEFEERRSQKLESLGVLAGGIAHDFNNLLTIMMGNLSLMSTTLITTVDEEHQLDKVKKATDRARNLTRQLLTFAKGGAPLQEAQRLNPLIRESVAFSLSGSNVECHMDLPENLWWSRVDGSQISQLISNLVINACQAMPQGGRLDINAKNITQNNKRMINIEFRDQGQGISKTDKARIFDPYFTTREHGSGLGLAIANSVVEMHGGTLSVHTRPGHGSTFEVMLPASFEKTPELASSLDSSTSSPTIPLNILFMDDERDIRLLLDLMLNNLGHISVGTSHGEEAVAAFTEAQNQDQPFDLVILDLTIAGGIGGLETLSLLRKHDLQIKVIVASGYSDDPVMANYRKFGFSGILPKPFNLDDLTLAIDKLSNSPKT